VEIQLNFQLSPDLVKSMDRLRDTMQQVAQHIDKTTCPLAKLISERLGPGTFSGDLVLLLEDFEDTDRLAAAERLAKWIPRPIHSRRWPIIQDALKERADAHGINPKAELQKMVKTAIFEAGESVWDEHPETVKEAAKLLRNKVETIVTNDLLGKGWDSKARKAEIYSDDLTRQLDTDERWRNLELQLELEDLRPGLTPAEQQLVAAMYESGGKIKDAAEALGVSPGAARAQCANIRKKINFA